MFGKHLMSVNAVVNEGPADAARVQGETDTPVDRTSNGRPAEKSSPVER